jgi:V/A-type H+-transporting ATPase subunit I
MFGYMFGDVGQGLMLAIAGLWIARRFPLGRLIVIAGISSTLFGFLFGSFFSREDVIPALWIHPLDQPLTLLAVPLAGGVVLLCVGILLNGLEAAWRGAAARWWRQEAGMVPLYLGLVIVFLNPYGAYVALSGLAWFLSGTLRRGADPGADLSHLIETSFQLGINTLSFARVGAFALAHAGLAAAVVALADAASAAPVRLLVMVLGNALVIILEGLVVSIQVTRLVLFEFFIRFLRGEGRTFRPLGAPPDSPAEQGKRKRP